MAPPLTTPAPLWRRLLAAFYDALLLLGLWLVTTLADVVLRALLQQPEHPRLLQLLLLAGGLLFFGHSWVRGGQTLGMRAWRLQLRRLDGAKVRWPIAAARYAALLLSWAVVLAPALLTVRTVAAHPHSAAVGAGCAIAALCALLWSRMDSRRRAPCDLLAGTEVVLLAATEAGELGDA